MESHNAQPEFTKFRWPVNESNVKDEYLALQKASLEFICWEALKVAAEKLRNLTCQVGKQYRFGAPHVVREFLFDDGVRWIARVNLPETNLSVEDNYIPKPISSTWTSEAAAAMRSELDTMSFLRDNTDIPIPMVYFSVGAPYIFMECIQGNSAMDMPGQYEILAEYRAKYLEAEASVIVPTFVY
jgi:hypothetical protein